MQRALLIFVANYESREWIDLEFLEEEYNGVHRALTDHGYEVDEQSSVGTVLAEAISYKIERFLDSARVEDQLLVYLSGHGFHYEDSHWFAASNSNLDAGKQTMRATNVPLDKEWPGNVSVSEAKHVLFVVDACRDRLDSRGGYNPPVMPPDGSEALNYLMACEPEKQAIFVDSPSDADQRYSLFTQAFRNVLADVDGYLPADRCRDLVEIEMGDLSGQLSGRSMHQMPRLSGEEGAARFPVLLESRINSVGATEEVDQADIWIRVSEGFDKEQIGREVMAVASSIHRKMAEEKILLADDPWLDWQAHERALRHCIALLGALADDFLFSPAEAALLVLGHQLYQGFRVRLARQVDQDLKRSSSSPDSRHSAWDQYPRLQRLTDTSIDPSRGQRDRRVVEAWVLHQELANPGDTHKHEDEFLNYLDSMLSGTDDLAELLNSDLIAWLFRAMQRGGSSLTEPPNISLTTGNLAIRHQFVGYLLSISQIMSLDMCELPSVLVEHIGGRKRINMGEVRRNIRGASWQLVGRTLRLEAHCDHQAVMVALQERADSLDGLLYTAGSVAGLEFIPNRASGDGAGPVQDPITKKGKFLPVATRFGLDGTRVRDLLAGEQLYADRSLAIRELYQNSLDACNVRQARELASPGATADEPWRGQILIQQGMQGTRQIVECTDNGSGMGRGELLHAFAQGGVRLSHLSNFQEEKLQWRKKRVPFHENSRFGIGVLSYFMIADEIEVITRKFNRDRTPGNLLRVVISGPDHLFHVEESSGDYEFLGGECGTTIRCYLRSDLINFSCVQALRAVLGVAQFSTTATYGDDGELWEPGTYRHRVNMHGISLIEGSGRVVKDPEGEVFWCEHDGSLLIDGINSKGTWPSSRGKTDGLSRGNEIKVPGAVVNLVGPVVVAAGRAKSAPRLTVDRSQVIDDISTPLAKRLRAATKSLAQADFLNHEWLSKASRREPRLADVIVQGLIEHNASIAYADGIVRMGRTGYMPGDEIYRALWNHPSPHAKLKGSRSRVIDSLDHLSLWRYLAHFPEDVKRALQGAISFSLDDVDLRPALPSDSVVTGLQNRPSTVTSWRNPISISGLTTSAVRLHEDLAGTLERLHQLNIPIPGADVLLELPIETRSALLQIVMKTGSIIDMALMMGDSGIHPGRFLRACDEARVSASDLVDYLSYLRFDLKYCKVVVASDSRGDQRARILLSDRLDGNAPWITSPAISSARVLQVAEFLNESIAAVLTSYAALGLFPVKRQEYRESSADDILWGALGSKVSSAGLARIPDVLRASSMTGEDPAMIVERLPALGITVDGTLPDPVPCHVELLKIPLDDGHRIDVSEPVPLQALYFLHRRTGLEMQLIADELRAMGLSVALSNVPNSIEGSDLRLLAQSLRAHGDRRHWLNPVRAVPLAHVLLATLVLEKTSEVIVERLKYLGMQVEQIPEKLPQLGHYFLEGPIFEDWIPYSGVREVPLGHVLRVALDLRCTVPEAVASLRDRGLEVAPVPEELLEVGQFDADLLGDKRRRISFSQKISTQRIVDSACAVGVTVEVVRRRLLELGADIASPRDRASTSYVDDNLFKGLDWRVEVVPAAFVLIKADAFSVPPKEISERLAAAGLTVQEFDFSVLDRPDPDDLLLLREYASPSGDQISLTGSVSFHHILVCAHRMNRSVMWVAGRLRELGLAVGDVPQMVEAAWRLVPKKSSSEISRN
ncbi:caspase family protein [Streptomyces sp. NPDC048253]|uniref:wHTH domain-containing protein n=1 Tax=Streptomyces sp. NPDC048253 TaxID=3365524 RepID=UPI003714C5CB